MKTRLYIGQPEDFHCSTRREDSHCTSFGTVAELREWLAGRRNVLPSGGSLALTSQAHLAEKGETVQPQKRHCMWYGGGCSPEPHLHKLWLSGIENVSCDAHLQGYLNAGWRVRARRIACCPFSSNPDYHCSPEPHLNHVSHTTRIWAIVCDSHLKLYRSAGGWSLDENVKCIRCNTKPASMFTTDGDSFCQECAKLEGIDMNRIQRTKETGFCIQRDVVHGCLVHTEPGENMCAHCKTWFNGTPRPRVRIILSSTRPCKNTPGCAGNMVASVRRYDANTKPELWWHCTICNSGKIAEKTWAVVASDDTTDLSGALLTPYTAEAREMTERIKDMMAAED